MKVHLENYRIIKEADVEIDGLTLVRGQNDSGKSTIMRAMHTLTQNASGDSQIRYCAPGLLIRIEDKGFPQFTYTRARGKTPFFSAAGEKPIDKLGRSSMAEIDPRFPFKVLQLQDDKFLPNFVFQKEVPIFGQVDVYAFFASMFDSVAQLSRHLLVVRKRFSLAQETDRGARSQLEGYAQLLSDLDIRLAASSGQAITDTYLNLQGAKAVVASYEADYQAWTQQSGALASYQQVQPLLDQDMNSLLATVDTLSQARAQLAAWKDLDLRRLENEDHLTRLQNVERLGRGLSSSTVASLGTAIAETAAMPSRKAATASALSRLGRARNLAGIAGAGLVPSGAWRSIPSASSSLAHLTKLSRRRDYLQKKIQYVKFSVAPVLAAADLHRTYLTGLTQSMGASFALTKARSSRDALAKELETVTTCPFCKEPLKVPMTSLLGG